MRLSLAVELIGGARSGAGKRFGMLVVGLLLCSLQACNSGSNSDSDNDNNDGKLISFGLVVVDLNDDGRLDIVTANTSFAGSPNLGSVKVILQDGVKFGDFEDGVSYDMGDDTFDVAVGDVNDDNILDVLSTSRTETTLSFRPQAAGRSGTLRDEEELEVGLRSGAMVVADINGDNYNDIIVSGSSLVFWLFDPADPDDPDDVAEYVFGGRELISGQTLAVAQLNSDTRLDIIAGSSDSEISVLLQDDTIPPGFVPVFLPADVYEVGVQPADIAVADLVSTDLVNPVDGLPDIAVVSRDVVSVLQQRSGRNGEFNDAVQYPIEGNGTQLIVDDMNGDLLPDIAVTNNLAINGGISILLRSDAGFGSAFIEGQYIRAISPWGLGVGNIDRVNGLDVVYSNADGAWVALQSRLVPGEFLPAKLVGGDNNSVD